MLTTLPEFGGEHQYVMQLLEALLETRGNDFLVLAICYNHFWRNWCKNNHVEYVMDNVISFENREIIEQSKHRLLSAYLNRLYLPLGNIVKKYGVDILVCGQQGIFVPPMGCKVIHAVHDLMHRYEPDFAEIRISIGLREAVFSSVAKLSDVVLVDSKVGKKQFLESYCGHLMKKPHIEVLPFVAPGHIVDDVEEYIDVPEKYIFYPAQFWEHKNHINLIKAIDILKRNHVEVNLVLVGSEKNNKEKIDRYIENNGLADNIFIKGFVSDGQITYLYKHAMALVMPTYFGPTNIPPLEAMALGCPTIVSNKYAMGEQVGDAGLLFNPDSPEEIAQCIEMIYFDADLRNEMISKGYKQVSKWTAEDFKMKFISIVNKI